MLPYKSALRCLSILLILLDSELLRAAEVNKLDWAPRTKLKYLRRWIIGPTLGSTFLRGEELTLWFAKSDIVSTYNYKELVDRAPSFLSKIFTKFKKIGKVCIKP